METIDRLGNYEIRRTLGRGAMGIVYEGWDPRIERQVAIKTVRIPDTSDPELCEEFARFKREAQAAGRLVHPNIVGVYEYGETDDLAYIVMEYIGGPSLKSLAEKQGRLALPDIIRVMRDVLDGLQYSHERGVVHRDIKPANIMLTSDDRATARAKIADFGIARIESSSMTQAGTIMGTPAYMSPEQLLGQAVDARTDIYSAGVVLYQLLTGERPFEGGLSAIMHKALHTEASAPSEIAVTVPRAFDTVVRKAMAKLPEDRYSSAGAFADALAGAGQASPPGAASGQDAGEATILSAKPSSTTPKRGRSDPGPVRSSRLPLVAGVIALLAAGGGAWLYLARPTPPLLVQQAAISPVPVPAGTVAPPVVPFAPGGEQPNGAAPMPAPAPAPLPPLPQQSAASASDQPSADQPSPDQSSFGSDVTPAMARAAHIRDRLAHVLLPPHCAMVEASVRPSGDVALTGMASPDGWDELRRLVPAVEGIGATEWHTVAADPRYCQALDLLQFVGPIIANADPRIGLTLADGRDTLHDGQRILPRVTVPNFPAYVIVDYISNDGTAQHLYPQVADPRHHIAADSVTLLDANQVLNLGNPSPGHPAWEVGEPYGTDMIITIASAQPLFAVPRPSNTEPAADYINALAAAVGSAQRNKVRMSGNALLVNVSPK